MRHRRCRYSLQEAPPGNPICRSHVVISPFQWTPTVCSKPLPRWHPDSDLPGRQRLLFPSIPLDSRGCGNDAQAEGGYDLLSIDVATPAQAGKGEPVDPRATNHSQGSSQPNQDSHGRFATQGKSVATTPGMPVQRQGGKVWSRCVRTRIHCFRTPAARPEPTGWAKQGAYLRR